MKDILKATLQSGAASAGNLLAAVAAGKLYAVHLGPRYNAVAGLIGSVVAFCVALATAAGTAAFIQGASSRSGGDRWRFVRTVSRFYVLGGLLISLLVLGCAPWLAAWQFPKVADGAAVAAGCAAVIFTSVLAGLGSGLLQVEQEVGTLTRITFITALASVGFAAIGAPLIAVHGFWLIPLVQTAGQLVTIVCLTVIARRRKWRAQWQAAGPGPSITSLRSYWALTASALLSALVFYGSMVAVRGSMNNAFQLEQGGYFAAAWTVCGMYVDLMLRSFGQVLLPKLSLAVPGDRQPLVDQFFRYAVIFGLPAVLLVACFRHLALRILMHDSFLDAASYMTWMLPGDLLKMFSWLYGMVLLGAGDARRSMTSDLLWCGGFFAISLAGIAGGLRYAPCLAFTVMYGATLAVNTVFCRRHHSVRMSLPQAAAVCSLVVLTACAAWLTA